VCHVSGVNGFSLIGRMCAQFFLNFSKWSKRILFLFTYCTVRNRTPKILFEYDDSSATCIAVNNVVREAVWSKKYQKSFSIRNLEGMSGQRFRKLLNSLIHELSVMRYLEVGTFRGSTVISALDQNHECFALVVDDFSQFGAQKEKLITNLKKFHLSTRVKLIDDDFRDHTQEMRNFAPQVYFYDGPHDDESHIFAAELLRELDIDSEVIFIVDDWNWTTVRESTWKGIDKSKVLVKGKWEIFSDARDRGGQFGNWHNGCLISVLAPKVNSSNALKL
jgi:hypothetical protein